MRNTNIEKWQERLIHRLDKNLVMERGLSRSLLNSIQKGNLSDPNIKRLLKKDYKVWWMADAIAWEILQDYHYCFDEEERQDLLAFDQKFLEAKEQFLEKLKERNPDQYALETPNVCLLSREIRSILKKPRLTSRQIHQLMWDFAETKIQRLSSRVTSKNKDLRFQAGEFVSMVSGDIKFIKTEYLRHKSKEPEYAYLIIFNKANSLDFFYSVRLGFFDFMGNSYYKMSPGAQQIYRFVGWASKETYLTLNQLCQIAQIKIENVTTRRKTIEKYLIELQENGYIQGWYKEKGTYAYTIFKVPKKYLPRR